MQDKAIQTAQIQEKYLKYHFLPTDDEYPIIVGLYELFDKEPKWACIQCFLYDFIRGKQIERAKHRRAKA